MSLSSIGQSGMRAAQRQLDTTAHNLANASTPGFQRQTVVTSAQAGLGGVTTQVRQQAPAGEPSGLNAEHLAEDSVAQRLAVYHFAANLRTVETEDRVLGALLDVRA